MRDHRRLASWILIVLGSMLAGGWQAIGMAAEPDGSFTLYSPSMHQRRLLVVRARPAKEGLTLELVASPKLEVGGDAITAHPKLPLLYIAGHGGKDGPNAVVVPLDAAGMPQEAKSFKLGHEHNYLSTDRAGKFLLGTDYWSGAADVYPLDAAGMPGPRVQAIKERHGFGHCVLTSPDDRFVYVTHVKEGNALYQYAFDPATGTCTGLDPKDAGPPADSGPRHFVYHPRLPLLYCSEEQGLGVSAYRRGEDGRLSLSQRSRAVPADAPAKGVSSSDIVITPDGRHLYAGIRGHEHAYDFIACYDVDEEGKLSPRGLVPSDKIPWGMALSPDGRFLAVTGYGSSTLMVYAIAADGGLTRAATLPWDERIMDVIAR